MSSKVLFFCNKESSAYADQDLVCISSASAFHEFLESQTGLLNAFAGVAIQVELKWEERLFTNFYGLELLGNLRRKYGCHLPVLMLHHMPEELFKPYLEDIEHPYHRYLRDPSVNFQSVYRFLATPAGHLRFAAPLDQELFADLVSSVYHERGFLNDVFADLYADFNQRADYLVPNYELHINHALNRIAEVFPEYRAKIDSRRKAFLVKFKSMPEVAAEHLLEALPDLQHSLDKLLPEDKHFSAKNFATTLSCSAVLYIDDEPQLGKKVIATFEEQGMVCHYAKSGEEAMQILKADERNRITVVICDYHFYDEQGNFQRLQGYRIIRDLALLPNFLSVIALSGSENADLATLALKQSHHVIPQIKNQIFSSKQGLTQLCQLAIRMAEDNRDLISQIPNFTDVQRVLYKKYRESADYLKQEEEVSKLTLEFINQLKQQGSFPAWLLPRFNKRLNLGNPEQNMKNFKEVLFARRFVLALCQLSENDLLRWMKETDKPRFMDKKGRWEIIYAALKWAKLTISEKDYLTYTEMNTTLVKNLRFRLREDYSWKKSRNVGLTAEERLWLEKYAVQIGQDCRVNN